MKKPQLFHLFTRISIPARAIALFLFIIGFGRIGRAEGIISIDQLTPVVNSDENDFVWEANVAGVDNLTTCKFSWSMSTPDGFTSIFFRQTMWMGTAKINLRGEYLNTVKATCNGNLYAGTKSVLVDGPEPQVPQLPPGGSRIPMYASPIPSNDFINNSVCTYWTGYNLETGRYNMYRNRACTGEAGYRELDSALNDWRSLDPLDIN